MIDFIAILTCDTDACAAFGQHNSECAVPCDLSSSLEMRRQLVGREGSVAALFTTLDGVVPRFDS
jgi:hypothetical protein